MKIYRIKGWDEHYEPDNGKRTQGAMKWYKARTKMSGIGYARLTQESDSTDLFAAWNLLLMVAASQDKEHRGEISSNGIPLSPDDLELLTRFPAKIFSRALEFFTTSKIGWIEVVENGQVVDVSDERDVYVNLYKSTESEIKIPPRLDKIRLDKIRLEEKGVQGETDLQAVEFSLTLNSPSSSGSVKNKNLTDPEWLDCLAASSAYAGIDVKREHAKMIEWCAVKRKQATRQRFLGWLNRIEKPMQAATSQRHAVPEGMLNAF